MVIVLARAGCVTPIGLSLAQTAASFRAGITRFRESHWRDLNGNPLVLATLPDGCLEALSWEQENDETLGPLRKRVLQLARLGAFELEKPHAKLPLFLGLAAAQTAETENRAFLNHLAAVTGWPLDPAASRVIATGRASGLEALHQGCSLIRSGGADFVLVGGLDSFKDRPTLTRLDRDERLQCEGRLDGFIPGEGAGFLLLAEEAAARRLGYQPLAAVLASATGFEEGHWFNREPYLGNGLSTTFQSLFEDLPRNQPPVARVFSSFNGESYWAREWAIAYIRHKDRFQDTHHMEHPADCYGDLGAAGGPVLIALAAQAPAPTADLVYASSDGGHRAAVLLGPASNGAAHP